MIKWSSALAALAMAAACATAPDPMQQGAQLMAQMKAASGGARIDTLTTYHARGKRVRDGHINGTFDEWGDFRTTANTTRETFDGVTSSGGYDGRIGWSLRPDGVVRTEANPERLAWTRTGAYVNTQGYFFPDRFPATFEFRGRQQAGGKPFDVVKVTPAGGVPVEFCLDPQTHLLMRLAGANGPAEMIMEVHDYRTVDGVKVVTRGLQTMKVGGETHTETLDVETFSFDPVPPEKLGPPR